MRLRVCPFSVAVFMATAYIVTHQQRRKKKEADAKDKTKTVTTDGTSSPVFQVVFVLGGPGAGKGTQCHLLEERLGWKHLSAGDLLRAERKKGGDLGDLINARLAAGELVPSEVTCQLILNAMMSHFEKGQNKSALSPTRFLIDGFPRSKGNLDAWNQMTNYVPISTGQEQDPKYPSLNCVVQVEFVLSLECPEEVLTGRLLERGKDSGRVDDANLDIIRKRFNTFRQETEPIIEFYSSAAKQENKHLLQRIPSDQPVENVYRQIAQLFQEVDRSP